MNCSRKVGQVSKRSLKASALLALAVALVAAQVSMAQRGEDSGENDDFDDPGFDDNGYHQPQRDTDSSNQQPNQYSPDSNSDLDEDDEPDETHMSPQVAQEQRERAKEAANNKRAHQATEDSNQEPQDQSQYQDPQQYQARQQQPYTGSAQHFDAPQHQQQFYPAPVVGPMMLAGTVDATMGDQFPHMRFRRSASEGDIEDIGQVRGQRSLVRHRRHSKGYLGPVYTHVKTDKHANFKWGVKHKVGKHMG